MTKGTKKPRLSEGVVVLLIGSGMVLCLVGALALQSGRSLEEKSGGDANEKTAELVQQIEKLQSELELAQQHAADQQTTIDRLKDKLGQVHPRALPSFADDEPKTLEAQLEAAVRQAVEDKTVAVALGQDETLPQVRASQDVDPKVLRDVRVSNVKQDLELAILDVGRVHGIRPGMAFRVVRDYRMVARVKVDDVKDYMTGATVESTEKNMFPQVGDRAILVTSN